MSDQVNLENSQEVEYVSKTVNVIMCDGGSGDLGHPAVYFKIDKKHEVVCNYCNKKFVKKD